MTKIKILSFLLIAFSFLKITAQTPFQGTVTDSEGAVIKAAIIELSPQEISTITKADGTFILPNIPDGNYTLIIRHLDYKTLQESIEINSEIKPQIFQLEANYVDLNNVIVTGSFTPKTQLESSSSVSVLNQKDLQKINPQGTASILSNMPGNFVDAAAGEVFTKVYSRGISASAEDDLGWYYVSLQEDGLPVSLTQHSYFSPDLFHRYDITTKKIEALRGGSAAVTALNAPGGIYNFISYSNSNDFGGEVQLSGGIQGERNGLYRVEARIGGAIGRNWFLNLGGHYRYDEGARNTSFPFSKGGQMKFNLTKKNEQGYLKFYGKILNDKTNRWTGVAVTNWENPTAAFGQDFNNTSLLMPNFNGEIPDARDLANNKTNSFNPAQGVHAKDYAMGIDFSYDIGNNWTIRNNFKVSIKDADWQTSISNVYVSLDNPLAYFISGADFPIGQVVFQDVLTGEEVARVDNSGILGGEQANYITNGSLPNNGIMGTSAWYKQNTADEFMNHFIVRKKLEQHDINFGFDYGFSNTSVFTQGTFGFVTYEPNPRMLQVTLQNPNSPVIALSDENGLSNYGGLFYLNADAKVSQIASFISDHWKINRKLSVDVGVRTENIHHKGNKDRFTTSDIAGGVDGDTTTAYDNSIIVPTGEKDNFNYIYNYISYSAGIIYNLKERTSLFTRFSKGNKAPELNYYFNNFANVPINQKGEIQKIKQAEIGLKHHGKVISFSSTLFWSSLKDIGVSNFESDNDSNTIFYTPIQYNTSETIGLEWESTYSPLNSITFRFNGVIQQAKAIKWNVYDAAETVDTVDDSIIDYARNTLPFNPNLLFNLSTEYQKDKASAFFGWRYMGKREGNVANAFQLASYSTFNAGVGYNITKNIAANITASNLFNSEGLTNFFGANSFGANANGVTEQFITDNPDASFIVVPVLPRSILLKVNYSF